MQVAQKVVRLDGEIIKPRPGEGAIGSADR
jgi:hypothetical protein